jgi:hypothetical protein
MARQVGRAGLRWPRRTVPRAARQTRHPVPLPASHTQPRAPASTTLLNSSYGRPGPFGIIGFMDCMDIQAVHLVHSVHLYASSFVHSVLAPVVGVAKARRRAVVAAAVARACRGAPGSAILATEAKLPCPHGWAALSSTRPRETNVAETRTSNIQHPTADFDVRC